MISPNEQVGELSNLIKETGKKVSEDSYDTFFEFLTKGGLSDADVPIPLEIWSGIVQAFADASGYWVGLQAEILEPIDGEPHAYRSIGKVEVASAEPMIFVQSAGDNAVSPLYQCYQRRRRLCDLLRRLQPTP